MFWSFDIVQRHVGRRYLVSIRRLGTFEWQLEIFDDRLRREGYMSNPAEVSMFLLENLSAARALHVL